MKVEITTPQLQAIISLRDDIDGMIGSSEPDENGYNPDVNWKKQINLIDRFLKKNGYESNYK